MKFRMTWLCGLLIGSNWALAQDQAQQNLRQQQQQEQNWQWHQMEEEAAQQQEMPPPPSRPTGEWIKTWGSIARGAQNGDTGVAVGKLTKKEAEDEAVRQCLSWGGGGCKPLLTYHNQCVAFVHGPEDGGIGANATGGSIEAASKSALSYCSKENDGATCKVVYSACSEPIFRRY